MGGVLPNEPNPKQVMPKKPENLDGIASKIWDETAEMLFPLGLLTELDGALLKNYCILASQFEQTAVILTQTNPISIGQKNRIIVNPALIAAGNLHDRLIKILAQFGMTPSSRTRISVSVPVKTVNGVEQNGVFDDMEEDEPKLLTASNNESEEAEDGD